MPSKDGARSENLDGQVVMQRAASSQRRFLICQNLGGGVSTHPHPTPPPPSNMPAQDAHSVTYAFIALIGLLWESSHV